MRKVTIGDPGDPSLAAIIFLTARFRTGSTMLWNLYRQVPEVTAFYEPLHEQLPELIRHAAAPQAKHFFVKSYFDEYPPLSELCKRHHAGLGLHRLYLEAEDEAPDLKQYLDYVVSQAGQSKTAVLKENRIDLRLAWVKANYPEATIIHLHRSPRDEWVSMIAGQYEFGAVPLDADPFLITSWSRDLSRQFPFLAGPYIRHAYQRHYYLWKLSNLAGSRQSHCSIAYEHILDEPRQSVTQLLEIAGLDVKCNIDSCLAVITSRPKANWMRFENETWFKDLEDECDQVLDDLGLMAAFGIKPLDQIVADNPHYQQLLDSPQAANWSILNGQLEVTNLKNQATDKEEVIQDLIARGRQLTELIDAQKLDLAAKEEIIQKHASFRVFMSAWYVYKAKPVLRHIYIYRLVTGWRRRYYYWRINRKKTVKICALTQHDPLPLVLPAHYHRKTAVIPASLPTISIVTPSFNYAEFLERTIQSVVEQDYPALEYILQDGGSTDGSVKILDKYRARLFHAESAPDKGQANALNKGMSHATGEIMAYLNSDDLLLPGALRYIGAYFKAHPKVDVIYGHRILIDRKDMDVGRWVLAPFQADVLPFIDYIPQETLFWRRRIWDKVGGCFDESFDFAIDWDLLLRFQHAGAVFARLPRFIGAFRLHPMQKTTAQDDVGRRESEKLRRQYFGREVSWAEIQEKLWTYGRRSMRYDWLAERGIYI